MFGLEKQDKQEKKGFIFELERELSDPKKREEIKKRVDARVQEIKEVLRKGESKKEFERLGLILHGYTSLVQVISRFTPDKK